MSNEMIRGRVALQTNIVTETTFANCTPVANQNAGALMVKRTSGTTVLLNIYGCETKDGTYLQIAELGIDLTSAVSATKWNVLPSGVYASPWLKLVGDASGVLSVVGKG